MLEFRKVSAVFKSYDAAKADGCNTLAGAEKTWKQVAGDYSAEVYASSYWIGTAPACSV